MIGDERARFCGQCELNVYNLSAMSTLEAESLIARTEGRLCVRYYRRKDGSIITQDCPVGLRRLKQRAARIKRAVASLVLGFLAGVGFHSAASWFGGFIFDSVGGWRTTTGAMMLPTNRPPDVEVGQLVAPTNRQPELVMGDYTQIRPRSTRGHKPRS